MRKQILPLLSIVFLASCSTTNYTYRSSEIADNNIIASQVVVDTKLDLGTRIEATSSKRDLVSQAVDEAYYKALTENKIDLVVAPIFEIKTTDKFLFWGGKSVAKLSGFGATYSNSRSKVNAIKELRSVDTTDVKKFLTIYGEPTPVIKTKNNITNGGKKAGKIILVIAGVLLLPGLISLIF